MPKQVVLGAVLNCTFGAAPARLVVDPTARVMVEGRPAATIMDSKPIFNIPPFAMCSSPANPAVAAMIAAKMGTLAPCVPATASPWVPGAPTVLIGGQPALNNLSKCVCKWGGVISINNFPGSVRTMIP
ncbi:DUF4280 domain-containing protein [Burkholderia ubonensis]|uniref:DUF4280 domain-containing protein n=1 Tax=Burkholderia ubonensis TaxID=101571 RepID=UPI0009B380B6|nr:DUF4280 domain-containing protein [Burkholderia ubonensis]